MWISWCSDFTVPCNKPTQILVAWNCTIHFIHESAIWAGFGGTAPHCFTQCPLGWFWRQRGAAVIWRLTHISWLMLKLAWGSLGISFSMLSLQRGPLGSRLLTCTIKTSRVHIPSEKRARKRLYCPACFVLAALGLCYAARGRLLGVCCSVVCMGWVALPALRILVSQPGIKACVCCTGRQILNHWATGEVPQFFILNVNVLFKVYWV